MDGRLASEEWIKIGSGGLGNAAKKYTARSKGGTTKSDRVKHWSGLVIRFIARVDIDALAANNAAADTWLPTTSETSQVAQAIYLNPIVVRLMDNHQALQLCTWTQNDNPSYR